MNPLETLPVEEADASPAAIAQADETALMSLLDDLEQRHGFVPREVAEQVKKMIEVKLERLHRIQGRIHSTVQRDIERHLDRWKGEEGNLIMLLHAIQNQHGYIPREVAMELSRGCGVKLARIYEVITFYHYFKLHPPGKHNIVVCNGTACYLKGSADLINETRVRLGVGEGQTTTDRKFHFDVVRCIGCCGMSPAVVVDGKTHGRVKSSEIAGYIEAAARQETRP